MIFLGNNHNISFNTDIGAIAPFSSKGGTVDGRMKPDITAPGSVVVSSVNSFDLNYISTSTSVVTGVTDGTQDWWYAALQGTSMASPVVTGIIALWLEAKPNLSVDDIKQILDNTAMHDSFTGNTVNNAWGRGKIDAWLAMFLIEQALSIDSISMEDELVLYPNPVKDIIHINTSINYSSFRLYNALGQEFHNFNIINTPYGYTLNLTNLNSGIYLLKAINENKIVTSKIVKN